jgi:predicted phage terminase large subunit-like protein
VTSVVTSERTQKLLARGTAARASFAEFCRFVLGIDPALHQAEWVKELQAIGDKPKGAKLIIVAPPGSGKTQLVGVGFTAWMIGRHPERHHGLLSYADTVGWARSLAVRNLIENSLPYRVTFPEVQPDKRKWGVAEFNVKRPDLADPHPTLRAGGTTSAVVSYRINGLLIDDPHDQKNSNNTSLREKVWQNYEQAILTRKTSDAWEVVIGTRWADGDFIGRLLKRKGYRVITTPALTKSGRSYWPEQYPKDFLDELRFKSPALFAVQYMGDTTGGDTGIIRSIATYDDPAEVVVAKGGLLVASGWDTAFKEKQQNDFSVGYIGGMDRWGRIFILDRIKGRWGLPGLLEQINDAFIKYSQSYVWIEDAASGTPAIQTLMESSPHIPTVPVSYRGGKTTRAHALAPFLHGGHVLFPKYADWFEDAQFNLTRFPYADHDDDVDALFTLIDNLTKLRHPSSIIDRPNPIMVMS